MLEEFEEMVSPKRVAEAIAHLICMQDGELTTLKFNKLVRAANNELSTEPDGFVPQLASAYANEEDLFYNLTVDGYNLVIQHDPGDGYDIEVVFNGSVNEAAGYIKLCSAPPDSEINQRLFKYTV